MDLIFKWAAVLWSQVSGPKETAISCCHSFHWNTKEEDVKGEDVEPSNSGGAQDTDGWRVGFSWVSSEGSPTYTTYTGTL